MVDIKKLAEISGGNEYSERTSIMADELKLTNGRFVQKLISQGKGADDRYEEVTLDDPLKVIILKIRRQMVKYKEKITRDEKPEIAYKSAEYDSPTEPVMVYSATSSGAKSMTEKEAKKSTTLAGVKVNVILYMLLAKTGDLVRLTVTGSSLYMGDDETAERKVLRLYNYLQTFKKDEYIFAFRTNIGVTQESFAKDDGSENEYFAMSFEKSDALNEKQLDAVGDQMMELADHLVKQDEKVAKNGIRFYTPGGTNTLSADGRAEYPKDEINLDDIPF